MLPGVTLDLVLSRVVAWSTRENIVLVINLTHYFQNFLSNMKGWSRDRTGGLSRICFPQHIDVIGVLLFLLAE